jgi:hypothetical protein
VKSLPFLGALKGHVFPKMGDALVSLMFIAASDFQKNPTVHNIR